MKENKEQKEHTESVNRSRGHLYVGFVVFSYGASSLGGVFVNKACLSGFEFGYPLTLVLLQLMVSVSALSVCRFFGFIEIASRSFRDIKIIFIPTIFFILNVTCGLFALKLVNIPMFSAFRRLSIVSVMILEYFVLGKLVSKNVMFTVLFMVCGSLVAAIGDLTFDPLGYALVFVNNFITAGNFVSIKKSSNLVRINALSLNYYVSMMALPMVATIAFLTGDLAAAYNAYLTRPELHSTTFMTAIALSAASAFLINFFTNLCTQVTSPLSTAITGQTKNILQTMLGVFAWGYKASITNVIGLIFALLGSCLFAYVNYKEGKGAPAKQTDNLPPSSSSAPPPNDPVIHEPDRNITIARLVNKEKEKDDYVAVAHEPTPADRS